MEEYKIYLSGGMMKFGKDNFEQCEKWRKYCKNALEKYDCDYRVKIFNPNSYFNFVDRPAKYTTNDEVMNFDLHKLKQSNLVIVNFNDPNSIGTMCEVSIAYDRDIPVIGLNENNEELHPWCECMCQRIFDNIDELLDYVEDFYLR